jgi:NAD-dependent dihydropyrimidine dehydrogenase PreA subunit
MLKYKEKNGDNMKRQVIEIDEEKCIGCGLCASACHQGAIEIINGKAKLTSDSYCDGLGLCLPKCPVDAIELIEKETVQFDLQRKDYAINSCVSSEPKTLKPLTGFNKPQVKEFHSGSELRQWPVQLMLMSTKADYLKNADILIAADCTAYAYGNFHNDFIKDKVTIIGCPKLDDNNHYIEKLTEMFSINEIKSITVVKMSVPCCSGLTTGVKKAMLNSGMIVPYSEVTIAPDGSIVK